jgi:hypothetical protein
VSHGCYRPSGAPRYYRSSHPRPKRTARALALAATLAALSLGCASQPPARTERGILLDVQGASLQRVESFTLRTDDGRELTFRTAPNFNEGPSHSMSPGHMRQHMALAEPVTVTYREEGNSLVALSATD